MYTEFWNWLLGVIVSSGFLGISAYLLRDTIGGLFTKAVEHRFETKLETFKANIRDNESELDQIRSFLASARSDRESAIQLRRLEAAETLLRARNKLSQLSMIVEYLKILNTEEILKDSGDPKIAEFIDLLIKPLDIDEKIKLLGASDEALPRLYLSEKSLKAFDVYKSIIIQATMTIKFLSIPLRDKVNLIKAGSLSKTIIELLPNTKEGFDKWGEEFAYYWATYFYDEVLRALRHELSGADDVTRDAESVQRIAQDSRRAQINVRQSLEQAGLPENLINPPESVAQSSLAAEKASK